MSKTSSRQIPEPADSSVGGLLIQAGKIKPHDVERILDLQAQKGLRFGEAAVKLGLVTESDIQDALSLQFDYPLVGSDKSAFSEELVAACAPFSKEVESLRALRTQLLLRWFGLGNQTMAITGAIGGEGASWLAANMAIVFSQQGKRTLLIDADLRQPKQHQLFRLDNGVGLSDMIAGRADTSVIHQVSAFPALSLLTAGTQAPNPTELLARPTFGQLLDTFRKQYDIILLDTTPAIPLADCQIVAAQAHGVLIAARRNVSKLGPVAALKDMAAAAGASVVGAIVLN
jgi:chain length determinant protein tyrosine kinase EpsG